MKQNQFGFKPFDRVLVRDSDDQPWCINFYTKLNSSEHHVCLYGVWRQCIPYNEETANLIGTTEAYTPPQPKTYNVIFIVENGDRHQVSYTDDEFKKFIETAVLNNKDVSNFDVRKICG